MRVGLMLAVIPLCLVLGALPAVVVTRRHRAKFPGSFACRARVQSGYAAGLRHEYRRQRCYWVHDVLVLSRGRAFPRAQPLGIRSADRIEAVEGRLVVALRADNGAVIKVSADKSASMLLVGPFLVAELEHVIRADS